MSNEVTAMRQWLHAQLGSLDQARVLDIGCGEGDDLRLMSAGAPGAMEFVGVDSREPVVQTASERSAEYPRLRFVTASADERLPFEDGVFDVVYSVNTLECLPDKAAFVREAHRLLRPGGRLMVAHWDWDTQTFDGSDRGLVRKIVHAFNDWKQAWMTDIDPWMGRRLWKTLGASGRFDGEIRCFTLRETEFREGSYGWRQAKSFEALVRREMISSDEYARFWAEQEALQAWGEYFFSLTLFAFLGTARIDS